MRIGMIQEGKTALIPIQERGGNARTIDEETNTSGVASSQTSRPDNVGPLDADFGPLPSEKEETETAVHQASLNNQ